jgi:hypothetical protein
MALCFYFLEIPKIDRGITGPKLNMCSAWQAGSGWTCSALEVSHVGFLPFPTPEQETGSRNPLSEKCQSFSAPDRFNSGEWDIMTDLTTSCWRHSTNILPPVLEDTQQNSRTFLLYYPTAATHGRWTICCLHCSRQNILCTKYYWDFRKPRTLPFKVQMSLCSRKEYY